MNDPDTRALLAGMAMQGLLAHGACDRNTPEDVIESAVRCADEILCRLQETQDNSIPPITKEDL